jgi:hypothetical protein
LAIGHWSFVIIRTAKLWELITFGLLKFPP